MPTKFVSQVTLEASRPSRAQSSANTSRNREGFDLITVVKDWPPEGEGKDKTTPEENSFNFLFPGKISMTFKVCLFSSSKMTELGRFWPHYCIRTVSWAWWSSSPNVSGHGSLMSATKSYSEDLRVCLPLEFKDLSAFSAKNFQFSVSHRILG